MSTEKTADMPDLQDCRRRIDTIDDQIVRLFEERMKISEQVAAYKIPKYILFFDRLPLNGTGKVDSAATAARARAELGIA